jgi:hypothetical protein
MTAIRISADVPFVAGETVLCTRRVVRAGSASSLPSYRLFFSLPPLPEIGLLVTGQRVLLHALCLRLLAQVTSLWFPAEAGERERLASVSTRRVTLLGDCLELSSIEPAARGFRSQRMRLRLFVPDAEGGGGTNRTPTASRRRCRRQLNPLKRAAEAV